MRTKYTLRDLARDVRELSYEIGTITGLVLGLGIIAYLFVVLGAEIAP